MKKDNSHYMVRASDGRIMKLADHTKEDLADEEHIKRDAIGFIQSIHTEVIHEYEANQLAYFLRLYVKSKCRSWDYKGAVLFRKELKDCIADKHDWKPIGSNYMGEKLTAPRCINCGIETER